MDEPITPCGSYDELYRQLNRQRAAEGLPALPTPDEREKEIQLLISLRCITYNEYRAIRGRPPIPGGDIFAADYIAQRQQADTPLIVGG